LPRVFLVSEQSVGSIAVRVVVRGRAVIVDSEQGGSKQGQQQWEGAVVQDSERVQWERGVGGGSGRGQ
jgi:hypothetical protein